MQPSVKPIDTSDPNFQKWKRLHICVAKLESVTEMTSHMSFFAVLAAVDLKISKDEANEPLIIAMVVTTSLLVAVTMCVKMVASNILPSIQSIADMAGIEDINRSPHEHLIYFINISWVFANIVCPCLFAIDLILLCWLQFELVSLKAVYAATGIMLSLLFVFLIFGIIFFKQKIPYKRRRNQHLKEILKLVHGVSGITEYNYSRRRSSGGTSLRGYTNDTNISHVEAEEGESFSSSFETDIYTSSSSTSSTDNGDMTKQLSNSAYIQREVDDTRTPLIKKNKAVRRNTFYGSTLQNAAGISDPITYFYFSS